MKRFLFSLWYVGKDNRKQVESHEESFECQADAQVRARAILNEAKRDKHTCAFFIFNDCTDYRTSLPYDWENKNPAPQRVGTLTDKKVKAWHDWLLARREAAQQEMARREDEVQAFRRRIAAIDPATCQRYDVREYQGEIVRNGLCFSWKIINGHVEQKIEVHYATGWRDDKDKLQCFTEMCEGRYVAVL